MARKKKLSSLYPELSVKERFCCLIAAQQRGDQVELNNLKKLGKWKNIVIGDVHPIYMAFRDLSLHHYFEALELSLIYREDNEQLETVSKMKRKKKKPDIPQRRNSKTSPATKSKGVDKCDDIENDLEVIAFRNLLASGYLLRIHYEGWKMFCAKWKLPPFLHWKNKRNYHRIQQVTEKGKIMAFEEIGMLRYSQRHCPEMWKQETRVPTAADIAAIIDVDFDDIIKLKSEE